MGYKPYHREVDDNSAPQRRSIAEEAKKLLGKERKKIPLYLRLAQSDRTARKGRDRRDSFVTAAEACRTVRYYAARYNRDGSPALRLGVLPLGHYQVDTAGGCVKPFMRRKIARSGYGRSGRAIVVHFLVPCGKWDCEYCAEQLSRQWTARACSEFRQSQRTWMMTLTMSPAYHAQFELQAIARFMNRHHRQPTAAELQKARASRMGAEVYGYYRRLYGDNNRSKSSTAYLAVAELHDSERTSPLMRGKPHYHMLLHERRLNAVIAEDETEFAVERHGDRFVHVFRVKDGARARALWPYGWATITLVHNEQGCAYVTKYLHKEKGSVSRVRASQHYGAEAEEHEIAPQALKDAGEAPAVSVFVSSMENETKMLEATSLETGIGSASDDRRPVRADAAEVHATAVDDR